MRKYALIVAGGIGKRMNQETPKQFLLIGGKPILMHTLERFHQADSSIQLILTLPKEHHSRWQELCNEFKFSIQHQIVMGGSSRYESVKNGLNYIHSEDKENKSIIAIHDGVRPFVNKTTILQSYELASQYGGAVACVIPKDSIREVYMQKTKRLDRSTIRLVQTPQTFQAKLIQDTYNTIQESVEFTDDASMVEACGFSFHLFEGTYDNIKITTPEDLVIAEVLLKKSI